MKIDKKTLTDEDLAEGNDFTRHRDQCSHCQQNPDDLCPTGAELLRVGAAAVRAALDAQLLGDDSGDKADGN